jgi:uridine kinase
LQVACGVTRRQVLDQLAQRIVSLHRFHPLRVAIDGIDEAGKTALADELVGPIEARGRPVIRASLDSFHRPRAQRHKQGTESPKGYFEDSFDYTALLDALLLPLEPEGNRSYVRAVFDHLVDAPVSVAIEQAPANAILLFDGIFLLRPELNDLWDFRIFLGVTFEVALQRALVRDLLHFGSCEELEARYLRRYFPAQRTYLDLIRPKTRADVIVKNDDPKHAELVAG